MRRPTPTPRPAQLPIHADAVYSKRLLCASLQWEHRTWAHAIKEGLKTVRFGKQRFCLGADVLDFFQRLAEQQSSDRGGNNQ